MKLVLTVGTGTAGANSDLREGLINTINATGPRAFWLIPSSHPDSIAGAELIRDSVDRPDSFVPFDLETPFFVLEQPDDLDECRRSLRGALRSIKARLDPDMPLVLNPTSGTKQMSAAATIAGLEVGAERIDYTVGNRRDGVVITGTERIQSLDTGRFFAERAYQESAKLIDAGSFGGAARLLEPWTSQSPSCAQRSEWSALLSDWQRLRYEPARVRAASMPLPKGSPLRSHLNKLSQADELDPLVLADVLDSIECQIHWQLPEEALARLYRAAELAAKIALSLRHNLHPPYLLDDFTSLFPTRADRYRALARDGQLFLGQHEAWHTLRAFEDRLGHWYSEQGILIQYLDQRNKTLYGHGSDAVSLEDTRRAATLLTKGLRSFKLLPKLDYCRKAAIENALNMPFQG